MQKKIGFKVFVVGDLKQSIYRFRGATMDAFKKMGCNSKEWEEYTLNINYRTDKRLLDEFDRFFNFLGDKKLIPYDKRQDSLKGIKKNNTINDNEIIGVYRYSKDEKEDEVYKNLFEIANERKKKIELTKKVGDLSIAEKTVAILVRNNYQIAKILNMAKKFGNITIESDTNGDLYKLQSTIDLCKLTSALVNPQNPTYLFDLLLSNNVNFEFPIEKLINLNEDEKKECLIGWLDKFYENVIGMTWDRLVYEAQSKPILMVIRKIYSATQPWKKYSSSLSKQNHYRSNYDMVFEDLSKEGKYGFLTLESINESLHILINAGSEKTSRSVADSVDYVKIICTTVHKSKGLEYDTVIMPMTYDPIDTMHRNGLDVTFVNGKVGYCISANGESMDNEFFYTEAELEEIEMEEARILYVALTRAINQFYWFDKIDSDTKSWGKLLEEM